MLLLALSAALAAVPPAIADAVSVGDCRTVVAALPSPTTDDARLASGYCRWRLGAWDDAVATLGPVTTEPFAPYARWIRARALADAGRPKDALVVLDALTLPGDAGLEVRLLRGRLLVETDRSLDARDDLRRLLDTEVADEARWWLALGAERRGEREPAIATWRRLWVASVRGPWSTMAAGKLAAVQAPVPDVTSEAGRALVSERVTALRAANRHTDALALLETLSTPTDADGWRRLARTRFDAKTYGPAAAAWRNGLGAPDVAVGAPADLFSYALSTARSGDYAGATTIYQRLNAQHPASAEADTAAFKVGYMAYDAGRCDEAREALASYVTARPGGKHVDEALYFSARCAWRSGDIAAAEASFDGLIAARPDSSLVAGARYWKARALGRRGDAAAEKRALEAFILANPTSGWSWFAAQHVGRTWPTQAVVARPAWPAAWASKPAVVRGEALLAAGFPRWAAAELVPVAGTVGSDRAAALAAAHALIAAGEPRRGQTLAQPWCVSPWKGGDPVAQQACTPRVEARVVDAVAARYHLDPLLPYGIMIAESGLDPSVTSIAGARGLMQLMPAEAGRMHADLYGEGGYDPDGLYVAAYNAALGTAELGTKQKILGDVLEGTDLPATIAAYNGGEDAVKRWVGDTRPAFDAFAEDIGYPETRQYVRRVLGNVMAYRWVYGDPPPGR